MDYDRFRIFGGFLEHLWMKKETAKNIIHTEYHENGQLKHEVKFENFKIKTKD